MIKIDKHIEIVRSSTSEFSSLSINSCDAILAVLKKNFTKVGVTTIDNSSDLEELLISHPDLVFLGMEFIPMDLELGLDDPNKIWISDFLDKHEIVYTGSSQTAHELQRNKQSAKQRVMEASLSTASFYVFEQNKTLKENDILLTYPLFVKPTNRGGGLGIDSDSVVYNFEQLISKADYITTNLKSDVLIEEYLPGREFSVAILKEDNTEEYIVMPLELVAPTDLNGARLLSEKVKCSNSEQVLEVLDLKLRSKITALAVDVFTILGARDYGRIDMRLDEKGIPHFLEANLIPSLISGYGSFPKACLMNIGLEYEPMIMKIVKLGFDRTLDATDANEEDYSEELPNNLLFPTTEVAY